MSFEPRIFRSGHGPRPSKRGVSGPAPARKNALWDPRAARKGNALVVTCAHSGAELSSKGATQDQLATYVAIRQDQLAVVAAERGYDLTKAAGRRWARRVAEGRHDKWVMRDNVHDRKPRSFNARTFV